MKHNRPFFRKDELLAGKITGDRLAAFCNVRKNPTSSPSLHFTVHTYAEPAAFAHLIKLYYIFSVPIELYR